MRALSLALVLAACAPSLWSAADPMVKVDYSNPGLSPSHWTLTVYRNGDAHFRSENNAQGATQGEIEPLAVDRDIRLTPQFVERIFSTAQRHNLFNGECDSHMKVAFQGWKRLSYSGPDGAGACEFNYSKDKEIQELGDALVSVATTVTEGARLENLLQHDPLGLDKEIEFLTVAAGDGRAQQLCAIRGILEHLTEDESVLDRVRKRAKELLAKAGR